MQNGKCRMQNECVAFGDYLNHFPEENTTILHASLCTQHFAYQRDKSEFDCKNDTERKYIDDRRTVHALPAGASRPINRNLLEKRTLQKLMQYDIMHKQEKTEMRNVYGK